MVVNIVIIGKQTGLQISELWACSFLIQILIFFPIGREELFMTHCLSLPAFNQLIYLPRNWVLKQIQALWLNNLEIRVHALSEVLESKASELLSRGASFLLLWKMTRSTNKWLHIMLWLHMTWAIENWFQNPQKKTQSMTHL